MQYIKAKSFFQWVSDACLPTRHGDNIRRDGEIDTTTNTPKRCVSLFAPRHALSLLRPGFTTLNGLEACQILRRSHRHILWVACLFIGAEAYAQADHDSYTNSLGMRMVRVEPGTFIMGSRQGDRDEEPLRRVRLSKPFHLSSTEVTNAQYEHFDPSHRSLRGKLGFSTLDDEAVVFVNWHEATAFCDWLTRKEGRQYRLPTEAEWEYACRSGTTTEFSMGEVLPLLYHNSQKLSWFPDIARGEPQRKEVMPLLVGRRPPNAWGLHDMHGNVEEWCSDWYGPYEGGFCVDPIGRKDGEFRVTRGGSHSTEEAYLRSANRAGSIPEDKSWLIGFRVAVGPRSTRPVLEPVSQELYQQDVRQDIPADVKNGPDPMKPFFRGPHVYVNVSVTPRGPFFSHNHVPSLTELPNGDLLAIWFSTNKEVGRELHIVASRLRYKSTDWEPASTSFFSPPDRNASVGIIWWDGDKTIWHFNGLSVGATWGGLSLLARKSFDNGVTWTKAQQLDAEHASRHMPIASVIRTRSGAIAFTADVPGRVRGGDGGSAIWISTDGGQTFVDPGAGRPDPVFTEGDEGGWIGGIHAPIAETADGRGIVAFGRRSGVKSNLVRSVSYNLGKTWRYNISTLDAIGGGQRSTMLRLREGPLFVASFTPGKQLLDRAGQVRNVRGLFVALSDDDGMTWSHQRLVTDDGPERTLDGGAWTKEFTLSQEAAEPKGYLTSIQARNGVIHLVSSRLHYEFNMEWIKSRMPPRQSAD